jgi:adenylate cyclase
MSQPGHADSDSQNQSLTNDAIFFELERICASRQFRNAERQKRFLIFVVKQALAGKGGELKESVLAMEVFDRAADYDPKVDTIVRVEARRLRKKLAEYYAADGAADPVRIELPTGAYVPIFQGGIKSAEPAKPTPRALPWALAAVVVIAAATGAAYWLRYRAIADAPLRVAVLPFQNYSAQGEEDYSDGVTEALITDLAKIRKLQVISRTSVTRFKNTQLPLRQIAIQLQVDYIVEGSIQRTRDKCRITAQLIRASDDVHIWAEAYDRPFDDILRVQGQVAEEIVDRVNVALDPGERQILEKPPTNSTEAYEALLKGRRASGQYLFLGQQDYYDGAEHLLDRALELDPAYVEAILERGLLDARRYQNTGDPQWRAKAEGRLLAVVNREPCHPVANAVMASIRNEDGDIDAALQYDRRAVSCNPNSTQAHNSLGLLYISEGYYEAAAAEFRTGVRVDPLFVSPVMNLGAALSMMDRKSEAVAAAVKAAEIEPQSPIALAMLGDMRLDDGDIAGARVAWRSALRFVEPQQTEGARDLFQGLEEAARGDLQGARGLLRRHRADRWMQGVLWRGVSQRLTLACEEPAEVLALLSQAPELRSYRFLIHWPRFAQMRNEPGFAALAQHRYQVWQERLAKYGSTISPAPPKLPPPGR